MKIDIDPESFGLIEDPESGELEPGPSLRDQLVNTIVLRVSEGSRRALDNAITERVNEIIESEARARVRAVLEGPIQPVSHWNGRAEGEPFMIESLIEKAVNKYISTPASRNGYGNGSSNMGELIEELVKNTLNTTLKPAVAAAKERMTNEIVRLALEGAVTAITPKIR